MSGLETSEVRGRLWVKICNFDDNFKVRMPEISRFYGIIIRMFYNDHNPPHFHVIYQEHEATFEISTLEQLEGSLPKRAKGLAMEWAKEHQSELMKNWQKARFNEMLDKIDPLE
jgi:hypothetical protein